MKVNTKISPEDQYDVLELEERIEQYKQGNIDEERFKLYRLTRGVYGQRQLGVQMFRIKLPYGRLTPDQLRRIADVSDQYATGNLHLTTRQDIQLHYVRLEDSPAVWASLAEKKITAREACGNTVRNVTASPEAGIDPQEPFDITPYAHATAYYFLRNPICQEMGRKIKIAFSNSDSDNAFAFMHDFGFIPVIKNGEKGFKVLVGGGLGAQAFFAQEAYDFLAADQIIPFVEAGLRIFDRYGERKKRHKARLKYLIKDLGVQHFVELAENEKLANRHKTYPINEDIITYKAKKYFAPEHSTRTDEKLYTQWLDTNVFEQKQKGYYGVYVKVQLGDLSSDKARYLADVVTKYASDDIRLTPNQNILLRYVHQDHLGDLYHLLDQQQLAQNGYDSVVDITACPGTDTCNLAVTNSTNISTVLEDMLRQEYEHLLHEKHIKIKISGCMNACGQHMIANIGLHGSSLKKEKLVIPAMQIVLAGGIDPTGKAYLADKVIKLPTKKVPQAVREILDDYQANALEGEYFNHYYERIDGKKYFYSLLKPLAHIDNLTPLDQMDWGQDHQYQQAIGVGECAGVILDVVGTIIKDAQDKLLSAEQNLHKERYSDSIYYSYSTFIVAAKAALLSEDISCNTHHKIIADFEEHFVNAGKMNLPYQFSNQVLGINKNDPTIEFAENYYKNAERFLSKIIEFRNGQLEYGAEDKKIVESYYKA